MDTVDRRITIESVGLLIILKFGMGCKVPKQLKISQRICWGRSSATQHASSEPLQRYYTYSWPYSSYILR